MLVCPRKSKIICSNREKLQNIHQDLLPRRFRLHSLQPRCCVFFSLKNKKVKIFILLNNIEED